MSAVATRAANPHQSPTAYRRSPLMVASCGGEADLDSALEVVVAVLFEDDRAAGESMIPALRVVPAPHDRADEVLDRWKRSMKRSRDRR